MNKLSREAEIVGAYFPLCVRPAVCLEDLFHRRVEQNVVVVVIFDGSESEVRIDGAPREVDIHSFHVDD